MTSSQVEVRTSPAAPVAAAPAHGRHPHFARFNALVDGGWLAELTPTAIAVWLCYERHADAQGTAWPSTSDIAGYLGHGDHDRVRKARRELEDKGLLKLVRRGGSDAKGGRYASVYRVCVPPVEITGGQIHGGSADAEPLPPGNFTVQPPVNLPGVRTHRRSQGNTLRLAPPASASLFAPIASDTPPADPAPPKRTRAKRTPPAPTADAPGSPFVEFREWWVNEAWPAVHGGEAYPFDTPDGVALAAILKNPGMQRRDGQRQLVRDAEGKTIVDVEKAKAVARLFLAAPEVNYPGHDLKLLRRHLTRFIAKLAEKAKGITNGTYLPRYPAQDRSRTAIARSGEVESDLPAPSGRRRL